MLAKRLVLAALLTTPAVALAQNPADEFSVIGTIHGGVSPTLRDTAVILDVVSGKTLVLAKGMCLPREVPVCIKAINDRTIVVETGGVESEIGRIDGAAPKDTRDYDNGGVDLSWRNDRGGFDDGTVSSPGYVPPPPMEPFPTDPFPADPFPAERFPLDGELPPVEELSGSAP